MRDRIKLAADLNGRSMNSEIVATLEEAYPPIAEDEGLARLHQLLSKFLSDKSSLNDDEEHELNSLIVTLRADASKN